MAVLSYGIIYQDSNKYYWIYLGLISLNTFGTVATQRRRCHDAICGIIETPRKKTQLGLTIIGGITYIISLILILPLLISINKVYFTYLILQYLMLIIDLILLTPHYLLRLKEHYQNINDIVESTNLI
jgi:hypothetical protein